MYSTYLDNSTLLHQGYAGIIIKFDFNVSPKAEEGALY